MKDTRYRDNPEYREKKKKADKVYYQANREKIIARTRGTFMQRMYGVTQDVINELLKLQDNKCAICSENLIVSNTHIDHDHSTSTVRGILCIRCNIGLGYFQDSPHKLKQAAKYLQEKYNGNYN